MGIRADLITSVFSVLFRVLCQIDDSDLRRIPRHGPGIIIANHTSNLEAPLLYVRLRPRATIGIGKAELWKPLVTRMIMEAWNVIPVHRGRLDRVALDRGVTVLKSGRFLCLAPEGSRSKGSLLRGQPGAAWFASVKKVPVYPISQWGCREMFRDLFHFKRPRIVIKVGRPFLLRVSEGERLGGETLQCITDEMMFQLASSLPETMRGHYSDLGRMTTKYLEFLPDLRGKNA